MQVKLFPPPPGFTRAIQIIAAIMNAWEARSQDRRLPKCGVRKGRGIRSTRGAQINLKEYPRAAQLKKVTVLRLTPASLSQIERVKKINENGIPAEKPRKSMATALG